MGRLLVLILKLPPRYICICGFDAQVVHDLSPVIRAEFHDMSTVVLLLYRMMFYYSRVLVELRITLYSYAILTLPELGMPLSIVDRSVYTKQ